MSEERFPIPAKTAVERFTETIEWIPVSERLPTEHREYLVTGKWVGFCINAFYPDTKTFTIQSSVDDDVLAWAELPAGYKPEDSK